LLDAVCSAAKMIPFAVSVLCALCLAQLAEGYTFVPSGAHRVQLLPSTHRKASAPARFARSSLLGLAAAPAAPAPAPREPSKEVKEVEKSFGQKALGVLQSNWLVLGEIFVIWLAKQNPYLGCTGGPLRPELTVSKFGVFMIFFINGVALSLSGGSPAEIESATKTNVLIQSFNFGFIPLCIKLLAPFYPDPAFRCALCLIHALIHAPLQP